MSLNVLFSNRDLEGIGAPLERLRKATVNANVNENTNKTTHVRNTHVQHIHQGGVNLNRLTLAFTFAYDVRNLSIIPSVT